jgi:hypothetical protein
VAQLGRFAYRSSRDGDPSSTLAKYADVVLDVSVTAEACPET